MLSLRKIMDQNFAGLNEDQVTLGKEIVNTFEVKFDILDAKISNARVVNFLLEKSAPTALLVMVTENMERTIKLMEQYQNGCKTYKDFYSRILKSGNATDEMNAILKSSIEVGDKVANFLMKTN